MSSFLSLHPREPLQTHPRLAGTVVEQTSKPYEKAAQIAEAFEAYAK